MDWEKFQYRINNDQQFRKNLAKSSYFWFFHIYFAKYIKCETAPFQKELCELLEDAKLFFLEVIGFRGSAKTTYSMMGYPIWAMICGLSHFTILINDTFSQVKSNIYNLKNELETNELLIQDFGPFEENGEWTKTDIVIPLYGTKIMARSAGQKVRGSIFKEFRPQLIVCDDLENLASVKTKEKRDELYRWFCGEILTLTDEDGEITAEAASDRIILIGNLLHKDSLMSKIKNDIESGKRDGVTRSYPLIKDRRIQWKGKYPNKAAILRKKRKIGDLRTWQREYLLKIVAEEGQIIKDEHITYYQEVLALEPDIIATGVDLAISTKATADCTAMVSAKCFFVNGELKIYIAKHPVNERLGFHSTMDRADEQSRMMGSGQPTQLFVEQVAYQKAAIEEMERRMLPVQGITPGGQDKRARMVSISHLIYNGQVLFPMTGCEDLILQLTGFGSEKHDDLSDALVILLMGLMRLGVQDDEIVWVR